MGSPRSSSGSGTRVSLALGISGGAAFSAGAAFALYIWIYLQDATSWHTSLVLAGVFELIVAVLSALWFNAPAGGPPWRRPL